MSEFKPLIEMNEDELKAYSYDLYCKVINSAMEPIEGLQIAIDVIAGQHMPELETKEYWLKQSHEECAEVIVERILIARKAQARFNNWLKDKK